MLFLINHLGIYRKKNVFLRSYLGETLELCANSIRYRIQMIQIQRRQRWFDHPWGGRREWLLTIVDIYFRVRIQYLRGPVFFVSWPLNLCCLRGDKIGDSRKSTDLKCWMACPHHSAIKWRRTKGAPQIGQRRRMSRSASLQLVQRTASKPGHANVDWVYAETHTTTYYYTLFGSRTNNCFSISAQRHSGLITRTRRSHEKSIKYIEINTWCFILCWCALL